MSIIAKHELEKLAELEHEQWLSWITVLINELEGIFSEEKSDQQILEELLPYLKTKLKKWKENVKPYSGLTEETKELDRIWARKILEVINSEV